MREYSSLAKKSPTTLNNLLNYDSEEEWESEEDGASESQDEGCDSDNEGPVTLYFKDPTPQTSPAQDIQNGLADQQEQRSKEAEDSKGNAKKKKNKEKENNINRKFPAN